MVVHTYAAEKNQEVGCFCSAGRRPENSDEDKAREAGVNGARVYTAARSRQVASPSTAVRRQGSKGKVVTSSSVVSVCGKVPPLGVCAGVLFGATASMPARELSGTYLPPVGLSIALTD